MSKKKHQKRKQGSGQLQRTQPATAAQVVPEPRAEPVPTGLVILTLPSEENPVVRLEIDRQATPEQRELARRYWMPDPDGGWAELVADLGSVGQIAHELQKVCTAYLLSALCWSCRAPLSVTSRNDAISVGGQYLRHSERQRIPRTECGACEKSRMDRLERERRAAIERERETERARRRAVKEYLEGDSFGALPSRWERRTAGLGSSGDEECLGARAACLLYTLVEHSRVSEVLPGGDDKSALPFGWMYPTANEQDLLIRLFERGWILVDPSADTTGFIFDDTGQADAFYPAKVACRLATSLGTTIDDLTAILLAHSAQTHMEGIRREIREMEVVSLYVYLNYQLMQDYGYPIVPVSKQAELQEKLALGLARFTFGQMVCLCWRAVDTAASWKERKGLSNAHASSAAVTILGGKIDHAVGHPSSRLPEYMLPAAYYSVLPGLAATRNLLGYLEEAKAGQRGCLLHDRHSLPCTHCLGMLYGGGEEAETVRSHFTDLGGKAVAMRPDLATKREVLGNPVRAGT